MTTSATRPEAGARVRLPGKPLLPGIFRVIPMGPDAVQLRSSGRVVRLTGPGIGDVAPALLSALDGASSVDEIAARVSVDVATAAHLVQSLFDDGLVMDGDGTDSLALAAAHQAYANLGGRPEDRAARLRSARVVFAGLGPVARVAARHLAAAGVGHLDLVDDSAVVASDQLALVLPESAIGEPRADVVAEECAAAAATSPLSPGVTVAAVTSLTDVIGGGGLVVVEVDEGGRRAEIVNAAGHAAGARLLFHSATTQDGFVGPAVLGAHPPCYYCLVQRRLTHLRHYDEHVAFQAALRNGQFPSLSAVLAPGAASLLGGLLSTEVLHQLFEARGGQVLVADLRTLEVRREELLAVPGCTVCGQPEEEIRLRP